MRCDVIAEGIIAATKELDLKIPVVVRLQVNGKIQTVLFKNLKVFKKNFNTNHECTPAGN